MARSLSNYIDFDNKDKFAEALTRARSFKTLNYVLELNADTARCHFDLDAHSVQKLIGAEVDDARSQLPSITRWIHFWRPEDQKATIDVLAEHYGFSPRLRLSMRADPMRPQTVTDTTSQTSRIRDILHTRSIKSTSKSEIVEKATSVESDEHAAESKNAAAAGLDLNHYRVVNELWHFMSVDWGHQYTSIGYNALYNTRAQIATDEYGSSHARPEGTRVWWWIVLCKDGTVLSIQENAFPGLSSLTTAQQHQLESIRYNCLNVFQQLSKATIVDKLHNPIMTVTVRAGRLMSHAETHISEEDSPSLLVYYLFDDWYSTYSLVAKSEHQYRIQLDRIRQEMFRSARLEHVHKLHSIGRQLAILKRMYEGYELIIERVVNGPSQQVKVQALQRVGSGLSSTSNDSQAALLRALEAYGAPILPAAALRFERLADRLRLYALSEIQSCLEEKESLMTMNFNLIAIKEESYVERLTRVTVLLAKVTILFIPVSLMATYFTINFPDVEYSPTQFWSAFAVLFFISILGLIFFGAVSGTQEAGPIYRSLTRSGIDAWRTVRGRKKEKAP